MTHPTSVSGHHLTPITLTQPLALHVFKDRGSPSLVRYALRPSDFAELASETWRDGCLRAGYANVPLAGLPIRLSSVPAEESPDRCIGFRLQLTRPDGGEAEQLFTVHSLRHVADRLVGPLLEADLLKPGEAFHFEVLMEPDPEPPAARPVKVGAVESELSVQVTVRSPALTVLPVSLRHLLEQSTPVALSDDSVPPVFYTREAFARAEACARRGQPAGLETGGVLIGSLGSCPESGEFFPIVHDVVEVQDAEEREFSLAYTSQTWLSLERLVRARQQAFPARAERLIGQAHGHPFLPNDGKVCAECLRRPTCTVSGAWASADDQLWHRAVFARQPWALCHIFGLTARGDAVHQLFGLRDGRLQARGYHLLPEFVFP